MSSQEAHFLSESRNIFKSFWGLKVISSLKYFNMQHRVCKTGYTEEDPDNLIKHVQCLPAWQGSRMKSSFIFTHRASWPEATQTPRASHPSSECLCPPTWVVSFALQLRKQPVSVTSPARMPAVALKTLLPLPPGACDGSNCTCTQTGS